MERFPHNAVVFKVFVELEARYGLTHRVRTHWESMWQGPMRIAQVLVECVLYRMCALMRQMLRLQGPVRIAQVHVECVLCSMCALMRQMLMLQDPMRVAQNAVPLLNKFSKVLIAVTSRGKILLVAILLSLSLL